MTTLVQATVDAYASWGSKPCTRQFIPDERTATEIYNATARPELWLIVLGITNPAEAGRLACVLLQSFAANVTGVDTGFDSDLASAADGISNFTDRRRVMRKRVIARPTQHLHGGYKSLIEYLQHRDPRMLQRVAASALAFDMEFNSKDIDAARADQYTLFRSEVSEIVFKTGIGKAEGGGDEVFT